VYVIYPDGSGDYPNLQAALTAAAPGDTVMAGPGVFIGLDNYNLSFGGKDLYVTTMYGSGSTIIDCSMDLRAFNLSQGETNAAVIEGFTILNGRALDSPNGGAIQCIGASPTIRNNHIQDCDAEYGAGIYCENSTAVIYNNTLESNGNISFQAGGGGIYVTDGSYDIYNNTIQNNNYRGNGGGIHASDCDVLIDNNLISGNQHLSDFTGYGGGIYCYNGHFTITDNYISGNWATYGGGIYISTAMNSSVSGNEIRSNEALAICPLAATEAEAPPGDASTTLANRALGGGIYCTGGPQTSVTDNVIADNNAWDGGGIYCNGEPAIHHNIVINNEAYRSVCDEGGAGGGIFLTGSPSTTLTSNTLYGNQATGNGPDASLGGGIYIGASSVPVIQKCIIYDNYIGATGAGGGIYAANSYPPTVVCNDVYANSVENYGGYLPDRTGLFGNFSANPLFCGASTENFGLQSGSPCLPGNHPDGVACGTIGALGWGCVGYVPFVIEKADVLNDQGKQLAIGWLRAIDDTVSAGNPILQYEVYRRIDPLPTPPAADATGDETRIHSSGDDSPQLYPPGDWQYVLSVPAHCENEYHVVIPTLEDSSAHNPTDYYTVFFVRAATAVPAIYFDSAPDSGYSVDNLAPSAPTGFMVAYNTGSGNALAWDPPVDADFDYFRVYRGTTEGFTPAPGNLVHATVDPQWLDTVSDGWRYHYKITAVDFNGNESEVTGDGTLTAVGEDAVPTDFALHQNVPNPFNPTTAIRFDLPEASHVTLQVFSVKGELVTTLVSETMTAGAKEVRWNGTDRQGRSVSSGVYFYRIETTGLTQTRKMVLLR
jgi:hypothetical protein